MDIELILCKNPFFLYHILFLNISPLKPLLNYLECYWIIMYISIYIYVDARTIFSETTLSSLTFHTVVVYFCNS